MNRKQLIEQVMLDRGIVYKDDYIYGIPNIKNKLTYANGDVYEGDFSNGTMHGKGILTKTDGTVKEGEWRNGKFAGTPKLK
jgi:hypothetical protein